MLEKNENDLKELEELENKRKESRSKSKGVPTNHYVPRFVVLKSTKTLTEF